MIEPTHEPEVWRSIYLTELLSLLPADKIHWAKVFADGHLRRYAKVFVNPKVRARTDAHDIRYSTEAELEECQASWPADIKPDMRVVDNGVSFCVMLGSERISDPYHGRLNAENRLLLLQERAKAANEMIDKAFAMPMGCADWGKG